MVRKPGSPHFFSPIDSNYLLNPPVLRRRIEARTRLRRGTGHLRVPPHESAGEQPVQLDEQLLDLFPLLLGARVLRLAVGIETALVADADGATVIGTAVGAHLEQVAVLRHLAIAANVEVVADGSELACPMVAQHLFDGVVAVLARGGTVDDNPPHRLRAAHK